MRSTLIIIAIIWTCYGIICAQPVKDLQLKYLKQEDVPAVDYKYVEKIILPQQDQWWKRGTHHFYANSPEAKQGQVAVLFLSLTMAVECNGVKQATYIYTTCEFGSR